MFRGPFFLSITPPRPLRPCVPAPLRLAALYDRALAPAGLRATQGTLLVALARAGDIPVTRLAGILGMDRTTLTRNLEPLERDGLVALRPGPDRRVKLAAITEKGRKALAAAMPLWREAQRQIAEGTGLGRWKELRRELGRITALAEAWRKS